MVGSLPPSGIVPRVVAIPRPASSVITLRRRSSWEVLMVERPSQGAFGGVWAFPGGAVEAVDHDVERLGFDAPWRAAALRETAEEVAICLTDPPLIELPDVPVDGDVIDAVAAVGARFDPTRLRYLSAWVTPEVVPTRFDARFYLAEVDPDVEGKIVTDELVDLAWAPATTILERLHDRSWSMLFPTIWHLKLIAATDEPLGLPPHPRRQIVAPREPFEYTETGIPAGEVS
jgi:8-oxo-dGTP pyrophosphatase MutT (NUDIX family)